MKRPEPRLRTDDAVFDVVESVYATLKQQGRVPAAPLLAMYRDEEIEIAFKKALALRLRALYDKEGVGAPLSRLDTLRHRIKWLVILAGLPVWVFLGMKWLVRPAGTPRTVQAALRVYATDWGLRGEGSRSIDWLLDGKDLHRGNTLFVVEKPIADDYRAQFAKHGYHVEDVSGPPAMLFRGLGAWLELLIASLRAPGILVEVAARGWLDYLRWTAFLEKWRPRHYVVYNHFNFDHVFRNSLLRKAGCESWFYVHSVHDRSVYVHAPTGGSLQSQIAWTYMSYDHEVHWGRRDEDLCRRMGGRSRAYHVWGPLWSAHVRSSPGVAALVSQRRATEPAGAIIALFDTSFGPASPYGQAEATREFFEAVAAMLDQPRWISRLLVFKSKNYSEEFRAQASPEVTVSFDRLLKHPRCVSLDADVAPGAVIAEADLTISIAYTSTTVEALGARRRALYFDPGGKFPSSYYEQFPNLVAHDREALARLCEHWLQMPEADFQKYLDHYIAPEFGWHLDAGAVARFRSALSAT